MASGWSFYLLHRSTLQIGGLTAATREAGVELLDAVLASPEAARADSAMTFVPSVVPWLAGALRDRGFTVHPFRYLSRALDDSSEAPESGDPFHVGRLGAVADLLSRAYPGADSTRPFAPAGTPDEWLDYTTQLGAQTGCGTLLPACSVVEELAGAPGRLAGVVLTTRIGPGTGHLAQVAVAPSSQGRGLGRRLVRSALVRLRTHRFERASLLVADGNLTAQRMYQRLGFEETGTFLSAWRVQPRRSTMAACSTGGVRTLR